MPNWCSTKYVAYTDREDQSELKRFYSNLAMIMQKPSEIENGFGAGWLGDVAVKHGINWERISCRGTIEHLDEYETGDSSFSFETETAWGPCDELWEAVIGKYDGVSYVYLSEEPGCDYFVNSDTKGRFLTERFLLEMWGDEPIPEEWYARRVTKPSCLDEREYFSDFGALAEYCGEITGRKFATFDELCNYFYNLFDEESNAFVAIREFEDA